MNEHVNPNVQEDVLDYRSNNIQATISAVWLTENMSINPKLVNSAISPLQKKVKLSAKQWNWLQDGEIPSDWQLRQNWATLFVLIFARL